MNTTKIKAVIADDHEIFVDGLTLMLSRQSKIDLAGKAFNGRDLVNLVREIKPDVVLTDIQMPIMDGIEATKQILQEFPQTKVISLSMFDEENQIVEMIEAGAKGYLLKNADKAEILDAIDSVMNNNTYYCKHTSSKLAAMLAKTRQQQQELQKAADLFNDREIEIIRLICQQLTNQEIADKVFLSKRTVEGHRLKILDKMNVKNPAGVVVYALTHNLITKEELVN